MNKKPLTDKNENLITDEFYYQIVDLTKNEEMSVEWFKGLKKVFDINDSEFNNLEEQILKLNDNQFKLAAIFDQILDADVPNNRLVNIYANYLVNVDGTKNLIDQISIVYQIAENIYFVGRYAYYTLTDYAKNLNIDDLELD